MTGAADLQLLFGLLAFQNGLIDQGRGSSLVFRPAPATSPRAWPACRSGHVVLSMAQYSGGPAGRRPRLRSGIGEPHLQGVAEALIIFKATGRLRLSWRAL